MIILNVYICESRSIQLRELKDLVIDIINENHLCINLKMATLKPAKLIKCINSYANLGLYFIGMELEGEIDGIQLADQVRKIDPRGFIVFIIDDLTIAAKIFEHHIEVLDLLCKENKQAMKVRIEDCLLNVYDKYKKSTASRSNKMIIKNKNTIRYIPFSDILFIEAINKNNLKVYTMEDTVHYLGRLDDVYETLDKGFYKWKQYIINHNHVTKVDRESDSIYLDNAYCLISTGVIKEGDLYAHKSCD